MSQRSLLRQFTDWRQSGEPLALVTVVATEGSTYSKAGRHLLIRMSGEHAGLVSGGCLEGDLAEHAADVIRTGSSKLLTYDMRDDADAIWGMGVGCNGLIEVLVQKLDPNTQYAPFSALADAMSETMPRIISLVTRSDSPELPAGTLCVRDTAGKLLAGSLLAQPPGHLPANVTADAVTMIHWATQPWPRLLVLGAGPDAQPVCQLASELGWEVSLADHRPALINSPGFDTVDDRLLIKPASLATEVNLTLFSACLVMSHHLDTDCTYMQQLALHYEHRPGRYLGVLGPQARRERILASIVELPAGFADWLRGPVGLDIGADSPESIALAVVAEIQAYHTARPGGKL